MGEKKAFPWRGCPAGGLCGRGRGQAPVLGRPPRSDGSPTAEESTGEWLPGFFGLAVQLGAQRHGQLLRSPSPSGPTSPGGARCEATSNSGSWGRRGQRANSRRPGRLLLRLPLPCSFAAGRGKLLTFCRRTGDRLGASGLSEVLRRLDQACCCLCLSRCLVSAGPGRVMDKHLDLGSRVRKDVAASRMVSTASPKRSPPSCTCKRGGTADQAGRGGLTGLGASSGLCATVWTIVWEL